MPYWQNDCKCGCFCKNPMDVNQPICAACEKPWKSMPFVKEVPETQRAKMFTKKRIESERLIEEAYSPAVLDYLKRKYDFSKMKHVFQFPSLSN